MQNQNQKTLDKANKQFLSLEGAVCVQYRRCGKTSCHCATGQKHGPYYYRCWRAGGKLHQEYIKPADVEAVKTACQQRQHSARELRRTLQQSNAEWRRLMAMVRQLGF